MPLMIIPWRLLSELDRLGAPLEHFVRDLNHSQYAYKGTYSPPRGLTAAVRRLRKLLKEAQAALESQRTNE